MADIVTDISRNKNWNARKGVNNPFTITFTSGGSAFNISGYTFSLQVRNFGSSTNLVSLTQGSGLTNNGAAGTLVGTISSSNLSALSPNDYYWQLTVVQPDTFTYVLLQGRFSLFEETSRTLTFGAQFRAFGSALPTATTLGKIMYIGAFWNSLDSKWDTRYTEEV